MAKKAAPTPQPVGEIKLTNLAEALGERVAALLRAGGAVWASNAPTA